MLIFPIKMFRGRACERAAIRITQLRLKLNCKFLLTLSAINIITAGSDMI